MSILVGFSFANVRSSSVGLFADTPTRTIKPALRTNIYVVPGRSGTLDYGGDTYDAIDITCRLAFRAHTQADMRSQQRAVAEFLAASGPLIFDDEPDKAYTGKIIEAVSMDEVVRTGTMEVTWRCQPYAESLDYRQLTQFQEQLPLNVVPDIIGTQDTPCIIRIHADTDISSLVITRTRLN